MITEIIEAPPGALPPLECAKVFRDISQIKIPGVDAPFWRRMMRTAALQHRAIPVDFFGNRLALYVPR